MCLISVKKTKQRKEVKRKPILEESGVTGSSALRSGVVMWKRPGSGVSAQHPPAGPKENI